MQAVVAVAVLEMKDGLVEALALVVVVKAHIMATVVAARQIQVVAVAVEVLVQLLEALVVLELSFFVTQTQKQLQLVQV